MREETLYLRENNQGLPGCCELQKSVDLDVMTAARQLGRVSETWTFRARVAWQVCFPRLSGKIGQDSAMIAAGPGWSPGPTSPARRAGSCAWWRRAVRGEAGSGLNDQSSSAHSLHTCTDSGQRSSSVIFRERPLSTSTTSSPRRRLQMSCRYQPGDLDMKADEACYYVSSSPRDHISNDRSELPVIETQRRLGWMLMAFNYWHSQTISS